MSLIHPMVNGAGKGEGSVWERHSDSDLFERFTVYLVEELGRSPRTAQSYVQAVKSGAREAGKPAWKVTSDDLRAVLRLDYAPATKRGMVVAYRQFHNWGVVEGLWKLNGLDKLKTPKVPKRRLPPLSLMEAKRALANATTPTIYRTAYLGLYAGLRVSESAQVSKDNWRDGWITVIGKGAKKREVPVHSELAEVRDEILSRQPSYRVLEVTWTRFRDRYGLLDMEGRKATTHTLRRTAATTMYEAGVPWEVVARILGHGEDVTASYAKISNKLLEDAIATINYSRGEPIQMSLF